MRMTRNCFLAGLLALIFLCPALAADEEKKVLFVLVFDKTCHAWCDKVRPMVKDLQSEYTDRVEFAELDATANVLQETKKKAEALGVLKVFADVTDYVPIVLIFDSRRKLFKELPGPKPASEYKACLDKAIAKSNNG